MTDTNTSNPNEANKMDEHAELNVTVFVDGKAVNVPPEEKKTQ
jgi:hypothetical protein